MRYGLDDLKTLMARLRDPQDGCPWDLKQNFQSVVPHTLEEVYELVDALENGDVDQIRQELGDVLFQLIFYSQIAAEQQLFQFDDVIHEITSKLLRRHPHVFPTGELTSRRSASAPDEEGIKARWDSIKREERAEKAQHSLMDDIPAALPATNRAVKMQKRAREMGFDWANVKDVLVSLRAEIDELEAELDTANDEAIADELGDVLFSAINLCRHLKQEPESVLRAAGRKFERRFRYVEQRAKEEGFSPSNQHEPLLDQFWSEAKRQGL